MLMDNKEKKQKFTVSKLKNLKLRYFELACKENYPHNIEITKELDKLEKEIRKLS